MKSPLAANELNSLHQSLEGTAPQEIVRTAIQLFGDQLILACSFGAEDVVLADMLFRINPQGRLFYLDTDFLFPETFVVRDRFIQRYDLQTNQIIPMKSALTPEEQAAQYGEALWLRDPDQCCKLRKVDSLTKILRHYQAWITGIRRDQSPTRASAKIVEWDTKFGLVKWNPLAAWSWDQVWTYIREHDVPYNELHDQHFPSIGCTHCTAPVLPGENLRSGRWKQFTKTECGLHPVKQAD
ncbi:MAG: phosphoadenylyl-sulfate reductase [Nitrospirales bacterium]|nr:phosphoadenylyl-sulfate reductase [Nitrospirales bacterium]